MEQSLLDVEVNHRSEAAGGPPAKSSWGLAHLCVIVFAVSFLCFAVSPYGEIVDRTVPDGGESVHVARSLATRGEFADPFFILRTGPTAHVAPVYPFLYSLFLRAFGTCYAALLILWVWNLGLLALQMALLPWLSVRLGLGVFPGVIAAGLGSISLHTEIDTRWECFLVGALLMAIFLLTDSAPFWRRWSGAVLLGLLWGVTILTNPVTVLLLAAWPIVKILTGTRGDRAILGKRFALTMFVAMLTVSPWVARNYARFGAFIFVRDNFGLELYTGNNPCAKATLKEDIDLGCHAQTHPNPSKAIAAQFAAAGEVSFNRVKLHQALSWIEGNRSAFLRLTAERVRQFWLPRLEDASWEEVPVWSISVLALIGLFVLIKQNRFAGWLVATTWLVFPAIYYVVPSEPRYGYPIYWTLLLAAGCAVSKCAFSRAKLLSRWPQ